MNDSLGTYLHDHLAGAAYAIELLEFMRGRHKHDDLGPFAAEILIEIRKDRDTLRGIAECVGAGDTTFKEAARGWRKKISRFKLGHEGGNALATFEALEFLAVGILGKQALWRALGAMASSDARLAGTDFDALATREQKQHYQAVQRRVMAARNALGSANKSGSFVGRNTQESSHQANGGLTMRKGTVAGSIVLAVGVLLAVAMLPDFIRYMKIRAM